MMILMTEETRTKRTKPGVDDDPLLSRSIVIVDKEAVHSRKASLLVDAPPEQASLPALRRRL